MKNFRILVDTNNSGSNSCAYCLEIVQAETNKVSFENRVEKFFSSFPTITKDWLHYKM